MNPARLVAMLILLAASGCATDGGPHQSRRAESTADRQQLRQIKNTVRALKQEGIDAVNFDYWRPLLFTACISLRSFSLPQENPAEAVPRLEQEFGPPRAALTPSFALAQSAEGTQKLPDDTWTGFVETFDLFKEKLERSGRSGTGREGLVALYGSALGRAPRWQLWVADRFSPGLTTAVLVRTGVEAQGLLQQHWLEVDSGRYPEGATRKIFGNGWQPRDWATHDPKASAALARILTLLAGSEGSAERRATAAVAVLDDFLRDRNLSGTGAGPKVCTPAVAEALPDIRKEDLQRYGAEEEGAAPERQGKKGHNRRGAGF
ncbi:hypothetical protein [Geomesophilobacter sediminis]|uniref:Lipoprotein n=1 Tax=Geomesophilobacter sediminis TaxID=2798584 RepID=A0A8J7JEP8_9BACT|nr:hypothetical protein [Geomesophilobacter sediminis]MBJ6724599.1 hypothetical protein [Geomesophilobacter sediminis]